MLGTMEESWSLYRDIKTINFYMNNSYLNKKNKGSYPLMKYTLFIIATLVTGIASAHWTPPNNTANVHVGVPAARTSSRAPQIQKAIVRPPTAGEEIPTLMYPNNVCVINTDLAPGRSIEEHIVACIASQRHQRSARRP